MSFAKVIFVALGITGMGACSLLVETSGLADPKNAADASSDSSDAGGGGEGGSTEPPLPGSDADLGTDAPASVGCTLVIRDSFASPTIDPRWTALGNAKVGNGELVLTEDSIDQIGAISVALPGELGVVTEIEARFEMRVTEPNAAPAADGVTVFFIANDAFVLGEGGGYLGLCRDGRTYNGYAVAFDSFRHKISGRDLQDCTTEFGSIRFPGFRPSDPVTITVRKTIATVTMTDRVFTREVPPGAQIRRVGFTASTGDTSSRHAITNIEIYACR